MQGTMNSSKATPFLVEQQVPESGILAFQPIHNAAGAIIDLVCTQVSDEAAAILHRTATEIVRGSIMEIHPSDLDPTLFRSYANVVETGRPLKIETEYIRNGEPHFWSVSATREVKDLVLVISDVTEQQRQAIIQQEREKLQETSGFVRLVVHEVRNPLNNILLSVHELESLGNLTPEQLFFLEILHRNADRIDVLVTELLHSSRKLEMKLVPGTLEEALSAAYANVADRCDLRGARFNLVVEPGLEEVAMDMPSLILAFTNLFVKALEAMVPDKGRLSVHATSSRGGVLVTVADNGKGLSERDLQRLNQPYYTGRIGGLGFGLTESRKIFNAHGILLSIRSKVGNGTTFRLLFPPCISEDPQPLPTWTYEGTVQHQGTTD